MDAQELRAADSYAIDQLGVPGADLMERAANALADAVEAESPAGRVLICVGKGNNGGDGLALARLLAEQGRQVSVFDVFGDRDWTGDAALMYERLKAVGAVNFSEVDEREVSCVVDCLLGTGASGAPREPVLSAVNRINKLRGMGATVVACDLPSGVDASSGEVPGDAVVADLTVTFHAMKPGLWIRPGKDFSGRVAVADIGLSDAPECRPEVGLIEDSVVSSIPVRGASGDKFDAGAVIVVGGSPGLTGAPLLCGLGAARAGAGYVTAVLPRSLLSASDAIPEIMGLAAEEDELTGSHSPESAEGLLHRLGAGRALVIGPGIGRFSAADELVAKLSIHSSVPTVIDADGLRAVAALGIDLSDVAAPLVLTPHEGEMAALLGIDRSEVAASRLNAVRTLAARTQAVVVLKGDDSLICEPQGFVAVSRGGAPALATAGSGDVLGGVIAALLARGTEPFHAACAAVRIHIEAGRMAAREGLEGVLASDIAAALPEARAKLANVPQG